MIIGVCRLELALPGNDSLKGKRRVRRSLVDRAQRKFRVSIAEVEALDSLQTLVLGAVYVTNDAVHARQVLQRLVDWVESTGLAVLCSVDMHTMRPDVADSANWSKWGDTGDATENFESR